MHCSVIDKFEGGWYHLKVWSYNKAISHLRVVEGSNNNHRLGVWWFNTTFIQQNRSRLTLE